MHFEMSPERKIVAVSYNDIYALVDLSVCINLYQQAFWHRCQGNDY
jgi:hypothetical protein